MPQGLRGRHRNVHLHVSRLSSHLLLQAHRCSPGGPDGPRPSLLVPSLPTDPRPSISDISAVAPKNILTAVAEKLERLAARLRRPRKKDATLPSLLDLEDALNQMLLDTDNGLVLPSAQHFAPVVKDSARAAMMPGVKTRSKRAGDPAYGAGANSGGKAKKTRYICTCLSGRAHTLRFRTKKATLLAIQSIDTSQLPAPIPTPHHPYPNYHLPPGLPVPAGYQGYPMPPTAGQSGAKLYYWPYPTSYANPPHPP